METKHTSTPYHYKKSSSRVACEELGELPYSVSNGNHIVIGNTYTKEDAEFIVKACNMYGEFVKSLTDFRKSFLIVAGDKSPFAKMSLDIVDRTLAKEKGE